MHLDVGGRRAYAYTAARPLDRSCPTVVFVHGAANDHSVFALQSRYFAHHGRNALAIDLPGHGRSDGPPLGSVEAIADWIVALLDAAGVRRASLVGHSLGSLAALDCAARHADRIERLALLGPAVPMPVSEALLAAARDDEPLARALIAGWSHSPQAQLGGHPVPGMWMTGQSLALMARTPPGTMAIDLSACQAYAGGLDAARDVRCATLLVLGARDLMAPPKGAAALIGALREPRVVTLPDCGHAMMAEQPDAVLDALRAFL